MQEGHFAFAHVMVVHVSAPCLAGSWRKATGKEDPAQSLESSCVQVAECNILGERRLFT